MSVIYSSRVFLVRCAKMIPFLFCFVVCVSYSESSWALVNEDFLMHGDSIVLNKPISFLIGDWFVYDWYTIATLTVLSISMETCVWNKLSIVYLAVNIFERDYFITVELYPEYVYVICVLNVLASGFLVYKGVISVTRK